MWKTIFKGLAWIGGILLVAGLVLHFFFVDRVVIGHNAMAPTIFAGDQVLVWRNTTPDMGDLVMCQHPESPGQMVIGRVYAKPGMTVDTDRHGQIRIAGSTPDVDIYPGTIQVESAAAGRSDEMTWGMVKLGNTEHLFFQRRNSQLSIRPYQVTRGIWLLGDNRSESGWDSRTFGEVDPATCRGEIFMRLVASDATPTEIDNGALDIIK
jgi:signal peptidase I